MRNLVIGLAVAALVGLATNSALAAGPVHAKKAHANIQLVAHHGPHHGPHHSRGWHGPPVYRPPVYRPRVVVPYPVLRPPVYGYPYSYSYPYYYGYPYSYGPSYGVRYYGSGVGISIGF